jgi:hypothetical protein
MTTFRSIHDVPPVPLPPWARLVDDWQDDDHQPYRVVLGADRKVTDHALTVSPSAVQWADGTIDNGKIEPPHIFVLNLGESDPLNSDQARELAAVLLEAAAQLDGWATR